MNREKAVVDATLAIVQFRVIASPSDGDTTTIRIEDTLALKGQYGDNFEWFTRVNRVNGDIQIKTTSDEGEGNGEGEGEDTGEGEEIPDLSAAAEMLLQQYDTSDTTGDNLLNYEESVAVVPGLTQDQFNVLDANSDGRISREELEDYLKEGCGCFGGCDKNKGLIDSVKQMFGDWLLVGLSLLVLLSLAGKRQ